MRGNPARIPRSAFRDGEIAASLRFIWGCPKQKFVFDDQNGGSADLGSSHSTPLANISKYEGMDSFRGKGNAGDRTRTLGYVYDPAGVS
jgi:hypothetical protein